MNRSEVSYYSKVVYLIAEDGSEIKRHVLPTKLVGPQKCLIIYSLKTTIKELSDYIRPTVEGSIKSKTSHPMKKLGCEIIFDLGFVSEQIGPAMVRISVLGTDMENLQIVIHDLEHYFKSLPMIADI